MKRLLHLLLPATISLGICAHCALGDGKPEAGIVLRLLACEDTGEAPEVFLVTKDGRSGVFDLPSSSFTAPVTVSRREVALKASGNDATLTDIQLPDQGQAFAVLLAPKQPEGFTSTVVRLDDDSFKPGDYYFVNCSRETLVLKLGENQVVVDAGKSVKSRPAGLVENGFCRITMSTRGHSADKIFASTRWLMPNPKRGYVIFTARSNGRIAYRALDE